MADNLSAAYLGFDISTTAVTAIVRSRSGEEGFVAVPMQGRTSWFEQPAFEHAYLPLLLLHAVVSLQHQGWRFDDQNGCLAISIRQHDLTLLDKGGNPLGPAITWECSIAEEEAKSLNLDPEVVAEVGPVAARMLTPKAQWLLARDPSLRDRIKWLLTTADWINTELIGKPTFGSSDGLSNAQISQANKKAFAKAAIAKAKLETSWQPKIVQSGSVIGSVQSASAGRSLWRPLLEILQGWKVGAPLGDNNAGALGMGVHATGRLALSAGSSGTAIMVWENNKLPNSPPDGVEPPLQFEFFDDTMLLTMLSRCALAYDKFRRDQLPVDLADDHGRLNAMALSAAISDDQLLLAEFGAAGETFPAGWEALSPEQQIASMQFSIAIGLLAQAKQIFDYLPEAKDSIADCVLTGGLSQSEFFQHVIAAGMELLAPGCQTKVSARTGPSRFQAAARGAMMAAMLGAESQNLAAVAKSMEELQTCEGAGEAALQSRIKQVLAI